MTLTIGNGVEHIDSGARYPSSNPVSTLQAIRSVKSSHYDNDNEVIILNSAYFIIIALSTFYDKCLYVYNKYTLYVIVFYVTFILLTY